MLFVRHQDLLKRLVAELLGIGHGSVGQFEVTNTEMPPELLSGKFCRLDINMIADGQRVNLEIQVRNEGGYLERAPFHWAKLYSSALPGGDDYRNMPRTVIISSLDFNLFE
ncbi:MAG: Rpn family recombination-promoting nuclease/putative transposase [Treponema sp.]|nr:Rpn family recombination-promoting nuclease/putative transposase [Treponema sp.]